MYILYSVFATMIYINFSQARTKKYSMRKKNSGRITSFFNIIQLCNNLILSEGCLNLATGYIQNIL